MFQSELKTGPAEWIAKERFRLVSGETAGFATESDCNGAVRLEKIDEGVQCHAS
jgi:hypothetical protein